MNIPAFSSRPGFTPGRVLSVVLAAAVVTGCSESSAPATLGPATTYEIRGVVVALPAPGNHKSELRIHHEAIPSFSIKGKVVGMAEMTMPFPLAEGVSLEGLAPGDPVAFTMEVREQPTLRYQVTRISELPAGTTLNFTVTDAPPAEPSPGDSQGGAKPDDQPGSEPKPR